MIEKRLNRLSRYNEIFKDSITRYQNALTTSNFKHKLKYTNDQDHFNSPYCQSVKTNIGKAFLQLIDKHF